MAIKILKPTSSGRRLGRVEQNPKSGKIKPPKKLILTQKSRAGRSAGKITVRHRGSGAKQKYRVVDFKQKKLGIPGKIKSIEYDPNRSGSIALVVYKDGEKRYIIIPHNVKIGDIVESGGEVTIRPGNRTALKNIPLGTQIYNIELSVGRGGQLARSAGNYATVVAKEDRFVHIELPSKEIRKVFKECSANIGAVSNPEHFLERAPKAGTNRHKGIRPTVRGKAMSPRAHPHGGGEGVNPIGLIHPKTPWGKPALGYRTRKKNKPSDKMIVKRRK